MNNTFKRQFFFAMFMLLGCFYAKADDDLITQQITVEVSEPGTLCNIISNSKKNRITNLKLKGKLNVSDIQFIREMADCYCGINWNWFLSGGNLEKLDISEAEFVGNKKFDAVYRADGGYCRSNEASFCENAIGKYCFSYLLKLKKIILPNCVTSIGESAFENCSSLASVGIPSGVTSIGEDAFRNCSSLASVEIPSSVTSIGRSAFYDCSSLASVEIPSGVTSIVAYTFCGCSSLASVEIPSSVTRIGIYAFVNCSSLASVEIPSSVTRIGEGAFSCCSSLASVEIPSSVTSIEDDTFYGCSSLASVEIPSSVTSIGWAVFRDCSSLASINIPDGVTSIGDDAFYGCSSLASVEIPSSVTSIKESTFSGCSSLTSVEIPSSVTSIEESAFSGCSSLASVYSYGTNPPTLGSGVFDNLTLKNGILHVPAGSWQSYWLSNWGDFEHIVEFDPTGIENVKIQTNAMKTSRYTLDGKRLNAPTSGVNIVKYNDGTVKKVLEK